MRALPWFLTLLAAPACWAQAPVAPAGPVAEKTLTAWKKALEPSSTEAAWRTLGWETELWPAVRAARQADKPILLWTMNGHPFGST